MKKKIKDYIYLDEVLLNSSLAQYEQGLVKELSAEAGTDTSKTVEQSQEDEYGLDGLLSIGVVAKRKAGERLEDSSSDSQKEIINSIVHDYAVDMLIKNCEANQNLETELTIVNEGDFVLFGTDFHIYDFEYLEDILSEDSLEFFKSLMIPDNLTNEKNKILKGRNKSSLNKTEKASLLRVQNEIDKAQNKNSESNSFLKQINLVSKFGKYVFKDSLVIGFDNGIAICKEDKFRLNKSQLSMLNDSKRKITIFGRVIANKDTVYKNGEFPDFKSHDLNKISSMMIEILLGSFNILKKNDKLIKPIAVYFE